jgi:chromosome segregation ATPase
MTWGIDDDVKRWRADADRREQARTETKAQMRREQEQHECDVARAGAYEEIAALKQRLAAVEQQLASVDELARAIATFGQAVDGKLAELQQLLTRHAELRQADPTRPKGFQGFARERIDEVLDLPANFIRKAH